MTSGVVETLRRGWQALEPLQMPMAVIGGLALSAWNHARYTRDADILIEVGEGDVNRLVQTMVDAGFEPKKLPPILQIDDQQLVQFKYIPPDGIFPFQIDLLFAGSDYQKTALRRATQQEIGLLDHPVKVLRPDDLILLKLYAGRMIDRADAAMLLRENRDEIDFGYLAQWIRFFKLHSEFGEIWREAFLNEPVPPGFES